jgi:hypothetical protein
LFFGEHSECVDCAFPLVFKGERCFPQLLLNLLDAFLARSELSPVWREETEFPVVLREPDSEARADVEFPMSSGQRLAVVLVVRPFVLGWGNVPQ